MFAGRGGAVFSLGTISATFHKEAQFPPGHLVPYQVKLASGSAVYVPADTADFVKSPDEAAAVPSFIESSFTTKAEYEAWLAKR